MADPAGPVEFADAATTSISSFEEIDRMSSIALAASAVISRCDVQASITAT